MRRDRRNGTQHGFRRIACTQFVQFFPRRYRRVWRTHRKDARSAVIAPRV